MRMQSLPANLWRRREISLPKKRKENRSNTHFCYQWVSSISPIKMKRRQEWQRRQTAFLSWMIISTDSLPSYPLPTSPPVFCHSHPSSPLHFAALERQCAPQFSRKTPSVSTSLRQNESHWKCEIEILNKLNRKALYLRGNLTPAALQGL